MDRESEVHAFLLRHLQAVRENDLNAYHETTHEDLSLYEWWITPHRTDGLPFHDFMMEEHKRLGTSFGVAAEAGKESGAHTRFDLANLRIQIYGEAAIASSTFLLSTTTAQGVKVDAHNESRVMVKIEGKWKVVHVHKSPAYQAPHVGA